MLRRIFLDRFTDSDAIYFPPGGSFKLVELAPNVQMVQGGGANNLIVNRRTASSWSTHRPTKASRSK